MSDLVLWQKPGKIAAEALVFGSSLIKPGVKLLDVAERIETFVQKKGGFLAFPLGLSLNDMAAHYTPLPDDVKTFAKGDMVKLDVGVHVDGYIGDTARTLVVGSQKLPDLASASLACLRAAEKVLHAGVQLREIGAAVAETAAASGFTSVRNLSGHGLSRWVVHSGMTIPNYDNGDVTALKVGDVVAIEPFVTAGSGYIKEGRHSTIYRFDRKIAVRDPVARNVLSFVLETYKTLPFCKRDIAQQFGVPKATRGLMMLERAGVIYGYAQLPDRDGKLVSQHEHTFFITEKGCVTTTLINNS